MKSKSYFPLYLAFFILCGCGGGSDPQPQTSSASVGQDTPKTPRLASQPTDLQGSPSVGVKSWVDGSSSIGGHGAPIGGVTCLVSEDYHLHAHLTIIKDGSLLAIPKDIGLGGCAYELHTHDESGIIHIETSAEKAFNLGQFFAVWGRYLTASNTASLSNYPTRVFIEDNGALSEVTGDPAFVSLISHRSITIVLGSMPATIPTYKWPDGV